MHNTVALLTAKLVNLRLSTIQEINKVLQPLTLCRAWGEASLLPASDVSYNILELLVQKLALLLVGFDCFQLIGHSVIDVQAQGDHARHTKISHTVAKDAKLAN